MVTSSGQSTLSDPLKGDEYFREIYLREVDRLAETLYVPNYRRPEVRRYAFERAGAEFIMAVPGLQTLLLVKNWCLITLAVIVRIGLGII